MGFTEPLPGANFQRNEWFSKSCLVANIPPIDDNKSYFSNMYENHFLTNFSLKSACLSLLPLCWRPRSCFMTAVLAECWMLNFPPVSCVAKDHQPVTGPQGTVHAGKILKRLYSSNMPFEKKTYIQKFKSAFHLVQYKLQNCLLFHFNYNHM